MKEDYYGGCQFHSFYSKDCLGCNPTGEDNIFYIQRVVISPEKSREISQALAERFKNLDLNDSFELEEA